MSLIGPLCFDDAGGGKFGMRVFLRLKTQVTNKELVKNVSVNEVIDNIKIWPHRVRMAVSNLIKNNDFFYDLN